LLRGEIWLRFAAGVLRISQQHFIGRLPALEFQYNWKNNFQLVIILESRTDFKESKMARLQKGERDERRRQIFQVLQRCRWGIQESEIAQELGLRRRTVNNYLRELQRVHKAEKDGGLWYAR